MRLPDSAHTSRPWRIHELTPDFALEDVWALPTPGGPGELPRLLRAFLDHDEPGHTPLAVRAVWAARWKLGALFGWDEPSAGLGARVPTLRDRLPADLRDTADGLRFDRLPFSPLYVLADEAAAEIANQTVHGVLHLGWVEDGDGGYRGQLAVLVKPNGRLGRVYLAAISPFRHLLVYPAMFDRVGRAWRSGAEPAAGRR